MPKKNTIMRAFKINEISVVDNPAQKGARMTIMKRGDAILDEPLNDVFKTENGKQFIASDYAYTPSLTDSSTWKLRLTDTPGGSPHSSNVNAATTMLGKSFRDELSAEELTTVVEKVRSAWQEVNPGKPETDMPKSIQKSINPKESEMTKEEIEKLQNDLAKSNAELAKAKKVSEMSDAEKAKYNAMSDADKAAWLNKSADERKAELAKAADADPVVYKSADGVEYRKSAGEGMIALAKKADDAEKLAKSERDARESSELKKRASETFKNLPGTEDEKAAILKSLEAIPEEAVRKKAIESVIAGDNAISAAFVRKGANGGDIAGVNSSAVEQLNELAKKHAADNKVTFEKAYSHVMQTPEGKVLYERTLNK